MARRVETLDWYELIGAARRDARLFMVGGERTSGLYQTHWLKAVS